MKVLKILLVTVISTMSVASVSAYEKVECSADPVFNVNSCNQCFTGESQAEWANLGFLKDEWDNSTTTDKILYKEEQEMPIMQNLSPDLVTWKENPTKENFWKYTDDFNKLYNEEEEGYILAKGKKSVWLESNKWFAYSLTKNKEEEWKNIGLLVYPIASHDIVANGEINPDADIHKECVLFKSSKEVIKEEVVTKEEVKTPVKKLPKTGPEHYILLLLAMVLGFVILKMRKKA
jgi:hypothetical protein